MKPEKGRKFGKLLIRKWETVRNAAVSLRNESTKKENELNAVWGKLFQKNTTYDKFLYAAKVID